MRIKRALQKPMPTPARDMATASAAVPAAGLSRDLFLFAGHALLPDWALAMLGRTPRQQRQARLAAHALWSIAPVFRAALKDGIASRACRRVEVPPEQLHLWG